MVNVDECRFSAGDVVRVDGRLGQVLNANRGRVVCRWTGKFGCVFQIYKDGGMEVRMSDNTYKWYIGDLTLNKAEGPGVLEVHEDELIDVPAFNHLALL